MRLRAATATHRGLVRASNEDQAYADDGVLAVADGVGGHPAGEVASELALQPIARVDPSAAAGTDGARDLLRAAVDSANETVVEDMRGNPERRGMATTLTAAMLSDGCLVVAHVGDSRAYVLRHGELTQVTEDHNEPGMPNMLTRVIGTDGPLEVDTPSPVSVEPGDRVLLCTDGLTAVVGDDQIAELLAGAAEPHEACDRLVRATLDAGAPDNVTVAVGVVSEQ